MVLLKRIFGITILLFGLVFFAVGIVALSQPPTKEDESPVSTAIGITVVLGLIPFGFGTWLLKSARDQVRREKSGDLESVFYKMIHNGQTTIADFDFAVQNKITRQQAREFLEKKCLELGASADANDKGMVVYIFGE
ncbi:MAG: hypothetical protein V4642_09790 [Bacteroidota bacterium]